MPPQETCPRRPARVGVLLLRPRYRGLGDNSGAAESLPKGPGVGATLPLTGRRGAAVPFVADLAAAEAQIELIGLDVPRRERGRHDLARTAPSPIELPPAASRAQVRWRCEYCWVPK
jgi:hypothetical protein